MRAFLTIEYAKMRRLRLWLPAAAVSLGVLLLTTMRMFTASYRATINAPETQHWEGVLLATAFAKAMTAPIFVAILASRLVEIEHQGNGWIMAAALGQAKGRLCLIKLLALGPIIAVTTVAELGGAVVISRLAGCTTPVPVADWVWYGCASFGVTLALLAFHVLLAARVENQLVGLGVGVLGAFTGLFTLLLPPWLAQVLPWGYYAVTLPVRMTPEGAYVAAPLAWPALTLFLLIVPIAVAAGLHLFDRAES